MSLGPPEGGGVRRASWSQPAVGCPSPAARGTAFSAGIQVGLRALHEAGSLSPEYKLLTSLPMLSQLQTYRAKVAVSVGLSDSEAPVYPSATRLCWLKHV